ncbi:Rad21 Rec8 like [Cordyceps militaris]|uniref:Rad21 Rec8 like n=1 Tax=Cordyceps militaris TaxID=73501 RepID=A0A2H4STZ7_CORMI|nr:Rad21 Rec8 like [Cordyceps militaris]
MFYSNQILTSTQYGVSTIWLIATVGKSNQKRVTKRAIQDVNVPRACDKILDPGAPLALRLQGNLLYGVSRVFADQCGYLLSDTEKTQSDMMTFFRAIKGSHLDLPDTRTKRVNITLQDDPNFDPMSQLPPLDLNIIDAAWLAIPSQDSATKLSQMSPLQAYASRRGSANTRPTPLINLELPPSSHSPASYRLASHLGQSSSPYAKLGPWDNDDLGSGGLALFPTQEDEFDAIAGIGLDFDGDGNLIGAAEEEPELPPYFGDMPSNISMPASGAQPPDDLVMMMDEEQALPDAEAFPGPIATAATQTTERVIVSEENGTITTSEVVEEAAAPARRRRAARPLVPMMDEETVLPRSQQKHWLHNYADIMTAAAQSRDGSRGTAPAQAKRNALAFVLHNGLADVGRASRTSGVTHPLAAAFSGWNVLSQLHPDAFGQPAPETPHRPARRRTSEEAFADEAAAAALERNVRPRHDEPGETGRGGLQADEMPPPPPPMVPGQDDSYFEMGMDAPPAMDDHHSSSIMPWSRTGSVAPGSSLRGGSAQKATTAPSPLFHKHAHHHQLAGLDRHSDPATPSHVVLDLSGRGKLDSSSMDDMDPVLDLDDAAYAGLDEATRAFLDYASKRAVVQGDDDEAGSHRWVDFEEIARPRRHDGAVAAQAFLHVLALVTHGVVRVRQDNNEQGTQPFGAIHVGIDLSLGGEVE